MSKETLYQHVKSFVKLFELHFPFPQESQTLTKISNCRVAEKCVNCHKALEIGVKLAGTLNNVPFADAKRNDKVITMATTINNIKCRERVVEINQEFHRICCVIESKHEMEEFLRFELTQQPLPLFKEGQLRKSNKSDLAKIIKSSSSAVFFCGTQVDD